MVAANEDVELEATRLAELSTLIISPVWAGLRDFLLLADGRRVARERMRQQLAGNGSVHLHRGS